MTPRKIEKKALWRYHGRRGITNATLESWLESGRIYDRPDYKSVQTNFKGNPNKAMLFVNGILYPRDADVYYLTKDGLVTYYDTIQRGDLIIIQCGKKQYAQDA